jgi:ferritin-like metal-binding protein YciE
VQALLHQEGAGQRGTRRSGVSDHRPGFGRDLNLAVWIKGLIEEAEDIMQDFKGSPALHAGCSTAPVTEYYETALWHAEVWRIQMGLYKGGDLLDATLGEEVRTGVPLTKPAGSLVNSAAKKAT